MHPNPAFNWSDETAMLTCAAREAFASIFIDRPAVVHAPLIVKGKDVSLHLSRRNRAIAAIDGSRAVASVVGRQGYQCASWYDSTDQIPTWLYEAVEIEGIAREFSRDELIAHVDALTETMEASHSSANRWTVAKMGKGKFEAMLGAITGFTISIEQLRGTSKFNQHKSDADFEAMIAVQSASGRNDLVAAIREKRA